MTKTFTLAEAQMLLPVLEALLRRAQTAAARVATLGAEMQRLNHRIFLAGGMHVDVLSAARRRAEHDKAAEEVKSAAEEIAEIGVRIHDLDAGVLDFPSVANGQPVLLCWRLGEPAILHWHGEGDDAGERRSVELLFGKGDRERPN